MARNYNKRETMSLKPSESLTEDDVNTIEKNFKILQNLISKNVNDGKKNELAKLTDYLKDRLSVAPASTNTKYVNAYPGGLVQHSLNVTKNMWKMMESLKLDSVSKENVVVVGLFHDLGKVGTDSEPYYLENESDWHRKNGMLYSINPELSDSSVPQRSLWWLNLFNVPLDQQEVSAICGMDQVSQTFGHQFYTASDLSMLLQSAVRFACKQGTGKTSPSEG